MSCFRFALIPSVVCSVAMALSGVLAAFPGAALAADDGVGLHLPELSAPPSLADLGPRDTARIQWDPTLRIAADEGDKAKEEKKEKDKSKDRGVLDVAKDATVATLRFTTGVSIIVVFVGLGYIVVANNLHSDAHENLNYVEEDPDSTRSEKRQARDEDKRTGDNLLAGLIVTAIAFGVAIVANASADALESASQQRSGSGDTLAFGIVPGHGSAVPVDVVAIYRW